ncbi:MULTISPECIES: putative polysaccharide biosynthesis protein [Bacillus]|uniref:putative polysaccharide biosynthesis protein n=1 Tax=Bacillus TaxID=1386 RepID=UPI000652B662|nr:MULTISPECIES: polysaccharide biosynthesis protein [Bacillus]KMN43615.1 cell division protein [Bacillus sp. LK2]MED1559507.1 polysaccharide biosynthesis protein [Bacillus paramycoides]
MSDSKFLRGTLIVTLGTFLVKFLGMIYVFPFHALVGTEGGTLYTYGYIPYTIFLSIATAGVPLAVSKFVSKYNALGDYKTSRRMFRSGMVMMIVTGVLSFLVLYMTAPLFAEAMLGKQSLQNKIEEVTTIIRLVSFALIVVPAASLIRGYFQGHQSMGPTTVSQIIEQIIRIVFLLAGSFIVIKVLGGTVATAVGVATFAAFVSAVGALGVLVWYWLKRKKYLDQYLIEQTVPESTVSTVQLFKELFAYAIPYVVIGLTIPLYQQIDTLTFNSIMQAIGQGDIAERALGIFTMWTHKLIMIPVSLATAFSLTLVPAITKSFTEKQYRYLKLQITQTFQANMFLTLPAVIGISALAYPIYTAFYDSDPLGGQVLMWYAPVALLFALFTVTAAILQGINQQKHAVIALVMGVILKFVCNVIFIRYFGTVGAILATAAGFLASVWYTNRQIKKHANYSFGVVYKRTFQIAVLTLVMVIAVKLSQWLLSFMISPDGRMGALITVAICAGIGGLVYGLLAIRTGVLERVFGGEALEKIQRKLGSRFKIKLKSKGA